MVQSFWEREYYSAKRDVIIVGGGFSGLWIALALKNKHPHYRITVIEAQINSTTASTRNAGFACFGSPSEILADYRSMGKDATVELLRWRFNGIHRIQKTFRPQNIKFEKNGGWELFHDEQSELLESVQQERQLLDEICMEATGYKLFERNAALPSYAQEFTAGIYSKFEAQLNPLQLHRQLEKRCIRKGVEILKGIRVEDCRESDQCVELSTSSVEFISEKVVFTTNSRSGDFFDLDIIPARAQVLITEPIPDLKWKGIFHMDEGYYYFRNVGNRLLLGGARHRDISGETTHQQGLSDIIQYDLEKQLEQYIIPGHPIKIAHRWSGIMAMGSAKFPIQKQISDRIYLSARLSGMGVATAPELSLRFVHSFF